SMIHTTTHRAKHRAAIHSEFPNMHEANPALAHQFEDPAQQLQAAQIGMWIFLGTEIMFFGGMFTGYMVYRYLYSEAFAVASNRLPVVMGTAMTVILICSSLTMAVAVHSAQEGWRRGIILFVTLTMILGAAFLGLKGVEYYDHFKEHLVPGWDFQFEGAN